MNRCSSGVRGILPPVVHCVRWEVCVDVVLDLRLPLLWVLLTQRLPTPNAVRVLPFGTHLPDGGFRWLGHGYISGAICLVRLPGGTRRLWLYRRVSQLASIRTLTFLVANPVTVAGAPFRY